MLFEFWEGGFGQIEFFNRIGRYQPIAEEFKRPVSAFSGCWPVDGVDRIASSRSPNSFHAAVFFPGVIVVQVMSTYLGSAQKVVLASVDYF